MSFLFDSTSPTTNPPDTEAVRLGAQRIRELKDSLQAYLSKFLTNAGDYVSNLIPASALVNASVDTAQLKPGAVTPPIVNASLIGDGLKKTLSSDPVSVNVDGVTVGLDASTPKKIVVLAVPTKFGAVTGSSRNLVAQTTSVSTLTVAADEVVLKDASNNPLLVAGVNLTVNIGLGVALNGLETGAVETGNTWYYVWLISDGTNVRGVLEDGSAVLNGGGAGVAPVGPDLSNAAFTGYAYKALVGQVRNGAPGGVATDFVTFYQQERTIYLNDVNIFVNSAGQLGYTQFVGLIQVPPNAKTVRGTVGNSTSSAGLIALAADQNGLGAVTIAGAPATDSLNGFNVSSAFNIPIKSGQSFYFKTDNTSARYALNLSGYTF